ncbi:EAL domain-containing protein [Sinorhizobium sp. BG8]|uniref:bifunctional diguanylate cyclase/phosphodiesterase n=1 Tax=Sinorhizobium sp. BG8 TaxID=2613773 RepID=UPI00193E0782|nr:EAL domain-containing protein [Sinorhizobium sp. BG8]QRM54553.1 EAL domain-containing protein [Sinorhizobium sp. BG8]
MAFPAGIRHRIRTVADWARPSLFPVLIATTVILTAGLYNERESEEVYRNELRTNVANELGLVSARLQGKIDADVAAIRGLANLFSVSPERASQEFNLFARKLILQNSRFRRISTAPGAIVAQTLPILRNENYPGTDYNRFSSFRGAAEGDKSTIGRPVMIGPVQLPDGHRGFNLFLPVFAKADGRPRFWGYIEGAIDEARLYRDAGLLGRGTISGQNGVGDIALSIRDVSVADRVQDPFFGDPEIFRDTPVTKVMEFPGGRWELAAIPRGGWHRPPEGLLQTRLLMVGGAILIIVPIFLTGGLVSERQRNITHLKTREREVLALSQRLDLALAASKTGIWEYELETGRRIWDERMYALHGLPPGRTPTDDEWRAVVHPDDVPPPTVALAALLRSERHHFSQYRVMLKDGSVRHLRHVGSRLTCPDGGERMTGISWDVTQDVLLNEKLTAAKEQSDVQNKVLEKLTRRLELALDSYQCGLWEADLDEGLTYWDNRMFQLYGLPNTGEHVTHEAWINAIHPDDRAEAEEKASLAALGGSPYRRQSRVLHKGGNIRHVKSVGTLQIDRDGKRKLVGLAFDVTDEVRNNERLTAAKEQADRQNQELEQAKSRIEHNALHDPLTGLGNRRKLDDELHALAVLSQGGEIEIGILHIDLDRFKQINDTLGHAAGDALLVHASEILRTSVRPEDLVARIGGDEFVVVVTGAAGQAYLTELSLRIIGLMQQPVDYNGHPCRYGVSIGVASAKGWDVDTRQLLINADIALYRAKALGRSRHEFFSEALQQEIVTNKRIADEILAGIENDEFIPYYQPQIEAGTLKLLGAEALIRWRHPREGLLTPDRFLKIAEDLNVMATLDRIMLEKTLIDCTRWAARGLVIPKISVNVSAKRLRDDMLVQSLTGLAITPGQISFELVESIFLDESDDVVLNNIRQIKELGIDIEIDDFGTGHTSIVSLLKLRPKRLKIDRQLVAPVLSSRHEQALVRSIIEIGRSLGIEIVAEGVETMEHAEMLSALGCDALQGYAFARPLAAEDFLSFGTEMSWKRAS